LKTLEYRHMGMDLKLLKKLTNDQGRRQKIFQGGGNEKKTGN